MSIVKFVTTEVLPLGISAIGVLKYPASLRLAIPRNWCIIFLRSAPNPSPRASKGSKEDSTRVLSVLALLALLRYSKKDWSNAFLSPCQSALTSGLAHWMFPLASMTLASSPFITRDRPPSFLILMLYPTTMVSLAVMGTSLP